MRKIGYKTLFTALLLLGASPFVRAQVSLNFESGNMAIDMGRGWLFSNILYDKSTNYHIYDTWAGKNTKISAASTETWIKSPWTTISSGVVSFSLKVDETKNDKRGYVVYAIPYNAAKANGEGTPRKIDSTWVTSPAANTIIPIRVNLPADMNGQLYKIKTCFIGMGSGSKTSVDNLSISGIYSSDPGSGNLPVAINPDADGDGVPNTEDYFPSDPLRAYSNTFPTSGSVGSLAFEDNWPSKGDFDFNDLVVDYSLTIITNAKNQVVEILCLFKLKASGAGFQNGFGFQLDNIAPNKISSVTGTTYMGNTFIKVAKNGLESNQTYATCVVFDNFFNIMPYSGNSLGVNTQKDLPFVPAITKEVKLTFLENGVAPEGGVVYLNNLPVSAFNFFAIANRRRGYEIHLPNRVPTDLVDRTLFGKLDDRSNGVTYYKTQNNLPWGLNLIKEFKYPMEKETLGKAYLHLIKWAESGGTLYPDWYEDLPGYRDPGILY